MDIFDKNAVYNQLDSITEDLWDLSRSLPSQSLAASLVDHCITGLALVFDYLNEDKSNG